jgi:hypothetical protein
MSDLSPECAPKRTSTDHSEFVGSRPRLPTKSVLCENLFMSSNIEPLAREMAERICRRNGMSEVAIPGWIDLHWQRAAAMLEAGVMDEDGEWIADKDVHLGIEAYRERVARQG